jgi:ubiquinone/menaquinone biosynthesis C-methylase UbiE
MSGRRSRKPFALEFLPVDAPPNAEQIAVWNDVLAPRFTRFRWIMADAADAHGAVALAQHGPAPGQRVLDVGCGFGDSSRTLGERVGPAGEVLGLDCAGAFVAVARHEAAGLAQVHFEVGDAQVFALEPRFDLVFSRFGTMFFTDPVAALRHLRGALRPGGRLLMLVWRRLDDNDWFAVPRRAARTFLPRPPDQAPRGGPGPFSMADADTVRDMLRAAGFDDVGFERVDRPVLVGASLDDAIEFQLELGPAGDIVRDAGAAGEAKRPLIAAELRRRLAPYLRADGAVVMPSSSWIVTARRP